MVLFEMHNHFICYVLKYVSNTVCVQELFLLTWFNLILTMDR